MPDLVKAIDISIYTGEVTGEQMQAVRDAGYEMVVVGSWHGQSANVYAGQQRRAAKGAGLFLATYNIVAPPSWTSLTPAQQMSIQTWPDNLFIAPDAELDITPAMLLEALNEAKRQGRTVLYTGAWWWNWFILIFHDWFHAHPDAFASEPCWLADYDWQPVLDTARLAHLGPVVGKQFKGTTHEIGGINADLSVFDRDWLFGKEEDMAENLALLDAQARNAIASRAIDVAKVALTGNVDTLGAEIKAEVDKLIDTAIFWHKWPS